MWHWSNNCWSFSFVIRGSCLFIIMIHFGVDLVIYLFKDHMASSPCTLYHNLVVITSPVNMLVLIFSVVMQLVHWWPCGWFTTRVGWCRMQPPRSGCYSMAALESVLDCGFGVDVSFKQWAKTSHPSPPPGEISLLAESMLFVHDKWCMCSCCVQMWSLIHSKKSS